MYWALIIGFPLVVLVAGALMTFAFAAEDSTENRKDTRPQPAVEPRRMILFQPTVWSADMKQVPVDEIITQIEMQLRQRHTHDERTSLRAEQPRVRS